MPNNSSEGGLCGLWWEEREEMRRLANFARTNLAGSGFIWAGKGFNAAQLVVDRVGRLLIYLQDDMPESRRRPHPTP